MTIEIPDATLQAHINAELSRLLAAVTNDAVQAKLEEIITNKMGKFTDQRLEGMVTQTVYAYVARAAQERDRLNGGTALEKALQRAAEAIIRDRR